MCSVRTDGMPQAIKSSPMALHGPGRHLLQRLAPVQGRDDWTTGVVRARLMMEDAISALRGNT